MVVCGGYILYAGKISPPFYFRPIRPLTWGRIQNWANWKIYKEVCNQIEERANSRLGESISDPYRAKIRLGEFKAVYSILIIIKIHGRKSFIFPSNPYCNWKCFCNSLICWFLLHFFFPMLLLSWNRSVMMILKIFQYESAHIILSF